MIGKSLQLSGGSIAYRPACFARRKIRIPAEADWHLWAVHNLKLTLSCR